MLFQNSNDLTHDMQCSLSENSKYRVHKLKNLILIMYPPEITLASFRGKSHMLLVNKITFYFLRWQTFARHCCWIYIVIGKQNQGLWLICTWRTVSCCTCTGYHELYNSQEEFSWYILMLLKWHLQRAYFSANTALLSCTFLNSYPALYMSADKLHLSNWFYATSTSMNGLI